MPRVAAKDREAFVEARQDEILDAALALVAERGYAGTSMAAIAEAVGLSKGTLYLYFESKEALLQAMFERYSLRRDFTAALDALGARPLDEIVHTLVRIAYAGMHARRDLIQLLLRELPGAQEHARDFLVHVMKPINDRFAALLAEKLGPERAAELELSIIGRSLIGSVSLFFVSHDLLGGRDVMPVDEDRALHTLAETFLHGLVGARG